MASIPLYLARNRGGVMFYIIATLEIMTPEFIAFARDMGYMVIERDIDPSLPYPVIVENCKEADFVLLVSMYKQEA